MTQFKLLHLLRIVSAIATPLVTLLAFVLFVSAVKPYYTIAAFFGAVLLYPIYHLLNSSRSSETHQKQNRPFPTLVIYIFLANFLVLPWLFRQPEIDSFLDRVAREQTLLNWKVILTAALLSAYHIIVCLRKVLKLNQQDCGLTERAYIAEDQS